LSKCAAAQADVREIDLKRRIDYGLSKVDALQQAVKTGLLELQLAGQCQIEQHVVLLARYPVKWPLMRDDEANEEARVRVAIEDGSIFYHGDAMWTAYRYLKKQNPDGHVQVFRNIFRRAEGIFGGCSERFFLDTQERCAALGGPSSPESILRWVVHQDVNHLLIVNSWAPDTQRAVSQVPERIAHTITFSAFARDYLRDLLTPVPLNDDPARWRQFSGLDPDGAAI